MWRKPLFTQHHYIMDYNSNPPCFDFFFFSFWIFIMNFFKNLFLSILSFKIEIVEKWASYSFDFPLCEISVVYGFAKVTLGALVYEFGGLYF